MKKLLCCGMMLLSVLFLAGQPVSSRQLLQILERNNDSIFKLVIGSPDNFRLQIIYTQINRNKNNQPSFRNYYFHYDPSAYFNPASMVKMPLAFLALEKLNKINNDRINKFSTLLIDSAMPWQKPLHHDTTAASGLPSIAHFIKRALLVSENDPYNRLYQFIGQKQINQLLHEKGYKDLRITRQFLGLTPEQNRYTNPFRFVGADGKSILEQPGMYNDEPIQLPEPILLGNAHFDSKDSLVNRPFDFTGHNYLSLEVLQQLLQSVLFPASVPGHQPFDLTLDDRRFLYQYLSQYPSETPDPKYDSSKYFDSYVKFYFRNGGRGIPSYIRVFNKVGWSYGFVTDVSYVADFRNNVEFMLSTTIYVNSDGIINDGKYEYTTIAHPFLYQLGQTIYQYELQRKRKHKANLAEFIIPYEKRDPSDTKPSLQQIDN